MSFLLVTDILVIPLSFNGSDIKLIAAFLLFINCIRFFIPYAPLHIMHNLNTIHNIYYTTASKILFCKFKRRYLICIHIHNIVSQWVTKPLNYGTNCSSLIASYPYGWSRMMKVVCLYTVTQTYIIFKGCRRLIMDPFYISGHARKNSANRGRHNTGNMFSHWMWPLSICLRWTIRN